MEEENTFKKIADQVVNFAPGLATVLAATGVGAPIAGAIGALGALGRAFGLGSNPKVEDIHTIIQTDPEASLKIALAEMDFQLKKRDQDIEEMRVQMAPYLKELDTKTIPWVDAIHKMGRQISNWGTMIIVFVLLMTGHAISPEATALIGGGNLAYQLIKGKGKTNGN